MATNLTKAFAELRKMGFMARQNFMCCSGCGGYALAQKTEEKIGAGTDKGDILGVAFYHGQDTDHLDAGQDFYLTFGQAHTEKHGDVGIPTRAVGRVVVNTLNRHGVQTEWNGNPDVRIKVKTGSIQ